MPGRGYVYRRSCHNTQGGVFRVTDHFTSGWLLRTDETTSMMAWAVTAASACLRIRSGWLAPSTTRCTLLVDKVAVLSCATIQAALLPLPAVRTTSGLSPKSVRDAASCSDALAWRNSSMV